MCRVDGCGGPRSGVCINSLSFEECPDVIPVPPEEEQATERRGDVNREETVPTPGGRSLDAAACDALLRERGGTMIGIVAGPEVGKTTLIGTMYELIHRARMDKFGFAGSETLRGYEERTFLSRMKSNRSDPDTPRTKTLEKLSFTHLRLATDEGILDVYFSDRSGEHFDNALSRPTEFSAFTELRRSQVIIMMVDLQELMTAPHPLISWMRRSFMAMEEQNLSRSKPLILVGTKADLLSTEDRAEAETRLATLREDLLGRSTTGIRLTSTVVASRAPKGSNKPGEGLEALLAQSLAKPKARPFALGRARPTSLSELDRLMDIPARTGR